MEFFRHWWQLRCFNNSRSFQFHWTNRFLQNIVFERKKGRIRIISIRSFHLITFRVSTIENESLLLFRHALSIDFEGRWALLLILRIFIKAERNDQLF